MIIDNSKRNVEKLVGIEIYSTPEIEGIGGVYKNSYKDFIVKEITKNGKILGIKEDYINPSWSDGSKDKYTTFNLIKINKDTFEAMRQISQALKISQNLMHYSGLKDRRSISVQKISLKGNFIKQLKELNIRDLFFRCIELTKKPIKLGANRGNNFTIVIRNIEDKKDLKKNIDDLIEFLGKKGFPNYFGLQRFGTYRPNSHIVGRYLLEGNFEKAFDEFVSAKYSTESSQLQSIRSDVKNTNDLERIYETFPKSLSYERSMIKHLIDFPGDYKGCFDAIPSDLKNLLISSFQSYIFNKMLSLRVKMGIPLLKPVKGDTISILDDDNGSITQIKYKYGGLYDEYLNEAIKLNRARIVIPLIGYETNLDDFPLMKTLFKEIIKQEHINKRIYMSELLYEFDFKGSFREMITKPTGLEVELMDDDLFPNKKKLRLEFSLLKGSYATMLLRELMK
ncbi:MAG: tRNA pseudouridine(13) synthase TruD [Promethearchaeota archaeon]|nr:MAG: tRNA pseudouridine(13) synthase TruD [Candidatus Lokiarchaeota archaeon]